MWVKLRCRCFYARIRIYKIYRTNNFDNLILSYYKAKLAGSPRRFNYASALHNVIGQRMLSYQLHYIDLVQWYARGMLQFRQLFHDIIHYHIGVIAVQIPCKSVRSFI